MARLSRWVQKMNTIALVVVLQLAAGALGNECAAGHKHKADLTGLTCSTNGKDAASCDSNCCEADKKKCGGLGNVACGFDSYHTLDDKWKSTAATDKTKGTACCTKKAKCGTTPSCPAGWKAKTNVAAVSCNSDLASCSEVAAKTGTCCELDLGTCGGHILNGNLADIACTTATRYYLGQPTNPTIYANTDKAWRSHRFSPVNAAQFQAQCCTLTKAKCQSTGYSCPAGYGRNPAAAALTADCETDSASCAKRITGATSCCIETGCEAAAVKAVSCNAGTFYPETIEYWKNKAATVGTKKVNCCKAVATCKVAACPAGMKKKVTVGIDTVTCPSDGASCNSVAGPCCELDPLKCGGLTGISCAYGFYDESALWIKAGKLKTAKSITDAWNNKPATQANKNTNCCTAKTVCAKPVGTTTPAPTVTPTATPASVIRRYSQEISVGNGKNNNANMVSFGVGGLIGMSVIMGVQALRSRMNAAVYNEMDGSGSE